MAQLGQGGPQHPVGDRPSSGHPPGPGAWRSWSPGRPEQGVLFGQRLHGGGGGLEDGLPMLAEPGPTVKNSVSSSSAAPTMGTPWGGVGGGIPLFHEIYQPCCSTPWRPRPPTVTGATYGKLPGAMSRPVGRAGGDAPPGTGGGDRGANGAGCRGHDCPACPAIWRRSGR